MRIGASEAACLSSACSAFHSYTIEHRAAFDGGEIDIRRYDWNQPTADRWMSDAYFIDMPLTPRPQPNWAVYTDGRKPIRLPLDRIWFVPPDRAIESGTSVGWQRSLHLSLNRDVFDALFQAEPDWRDFASIDTLRLCGTTAEWLLTQMSQELQRPGFASEIVIETFAQGVAAVIARACNAKEVKPAACASGGLSPWRMRRIRERAYADLPAPRLEELAQLCGLSVRQLSRAFRTETGQTVASFVQQATIERAHALLDDGRLSVSDISKALGFSGATSFAYAFRRATGMRPTDMCGRR